MKEKPDLSKELEHASRRGSETGNSADSLEREYVNLLSAAFAAACRIGFQFSSNRPLDIHDLLDLLNTTWELYRSEFRDLRFDGWPETPGMVFNVFWGNSARELAGKFTAAVAGRLHAADKKGILFDLDFGGGKAAQSAWSEWIQRAASELRGRIDLSNPAYLKRDGEAMYLKLQQEAERFFAGRKEQPQNLITLQVAVSEFCVSRATLKRLIAKGELRSYRSTNAAKNAPHRIDAREIAARFSRRK